ncbi:hypothetical protein E0Z10_g3208 [Xylaria hypoxylon]|uniref:Uncharacterized protein n=1 Tax=Xylaria hypoxylon TaxID=37992 RepID=A0A4Z0ZAE4_9PEZI|nr:hypothetical protein E0Z10_g3208 [Xylaria hypoxylon]
MPSSLTNLDFGRGANTSYKANVNRTKTRKWVEAKVQNYDGDDWGDEYDDDYADGNDQYDEPDPVPPMPIKPIGPRQPGQTGHQLPSSRTFSQPTTTSFSNTDSRVLGPYALRSPSEPPSLHVQRQATAPVTKSPSYATEPAYPTTTPSHTNVLSGPYSAGPGPTPSRFPPRKSSMGQQDRPDLDNKPAPKPDSRPGSSSSNRPWADQRSASPSRGGPAPAAKPVSFVRPADIYRRVGEEKEKERLSMESGRPSLDSIPSRTEGTSSPVQFRPPGEQRRRTSLESHDGSESARARRPNLAPVAERKSEYGMDGLLTKAQANQSPALHEPAMSSPELFISRSEPNDEVKADLMKSRRFSTSPQLLNLTRMSGFGDNFFSSSGNNSTWTSPNLPASPEEPRSRTNELGTMAAPINGTGKQPLYSLEDVSPGPNLVPTADGMPQVAEEGTTKTTQPQPSSTRPRIPGGWVSESPTVLVPSEQPTPLETQEGAHGPARSAYVQNIGVSPMAESDTKPADIMEVSSMPASMNTSENASNTNLANQPRAKEFSSAAEKHDDAVATEALATGAHYPTPQYFPPLETENSLAQSLSRPRSTVAPSAGSPSPQMQPSSIAQPTTAITGSEFSPTAPLKPNRAQTGHQDFILPSTHQRQSTMSTIETATPEKDSDKLREEIIKSLSPAPISPGSNGLPARSDSDTEPMPGNLTRESTYLAGVYDDYLSLAEEKSLQELSQAAKTSTQMAPSESIGVGNGSAPETQDILVSQPAPLSSGKRPVPENNTKLRRFSWQQDAVEITSNHVESTPEVFTLSQESLAHGQGDTNAGSNTDTNIVSPLSDSLHAENGAASTISHQVSQVSSLTPDASLAAIEAPAPISFATARPKPVSDVPSTARLSLAEEKEKVLIGDAHSTTSSTSEHHPALVRAPEQADHDLSPAVVVPDVSVSQPLATPTPFREILNLATYEERVQKFEETREQFYIIDSGLSNWLTYLQSQPEHNNSVATSNAKLLPSKPGTQPATIGASGASHLPPKSGPAALQPRRMSIGGVQQLMAGQSGSFGASGNQVGTKSKELLHAAGAFGNKGMKSGMKLFNKGKSKLRERAAGDKAFF